MPHLSTINPACMITTDKDWIWRNSQKYFCWFSFRFLCNHLWSRNLGSSALTYLVGQNVLAFCPSKGCNKANERSTSHMLLYSCKYQALSHTGSIFNPFRGSLPIGMCVEWCEFFRFILPASCWSKACSFRICSSSIPKWQLGIWRTDAYHWANILHF